jgi:mRNA interferase MazF
MARILRERFIAELNPTVVPEQGGQRPVVILSQDVFNERSGVVLPSPSQARSRKRVPIDL